MSRYTGSVCKLCRTEGEKLYLKGARCYSDKCAYERKPTSPGEQGQGRRRRKVSEYGLQLREKQKVRRIYGLQENKFLRYFKEAENDNGITGEVFLQLLERRLDNVVYRMGFARSRNEARQIVLHGHIEVNGKRVNIPSYKISDNDQIVVKESSRKKDTFQEIFDVNSNLTPPEWVTVDLEKGEGTVVSMPTREDIEYPVEEHLIVEYYSR